MWRVMGPKGVRNLRQKIEQDLVDGKTILPERVAINLDEIRNSIQAALAAPDKR
jgi:hypothetical protein